LAVRYATLKYYLISFLNESDERPFYLHEIYEALSKKMGKVNNECFKAQVRGILNASIGKKEGIFKRCNSGNVKGLYSIDSDNKTGLIQYLESVEQKERGGEKNDRVSQKEALQIYENHMKFAYKQANRMHGTSCVVELDELQSAGQIGLFKGAKEFRHSKSERCGHSPIPFLKKYVTGSLLNTIRKQKLWNNRNMMVDDTDVVDSAYSNSGDVESEDFTEDISISELREIIFAEMRNHLNSDEIDVVSMRWGLDGNGGDTYKQIGRMICKRDNKPFNDDSAKSWSWQVEKSARRKLSENSSVLKEIFDCYYA
jgi:DNA-directed RNA polymerase specialized sigma subunit